MSTKDISRSAVEGGRYNHNKYERNESHVRERRRAKVWLDRVRVDDEVAEASDPEPRPKVYKGFTDNLGPCYGWLASHCGERWDDVRSLLSSTFDTRRLSAWHIVNQHMLTEVEDSGVAQPFFSFRSCRFFIDDDGLLRDRGKRYYRSRYASDYKGPSLAQALAWARGRKVNDGPYKSHAWYLPEKVDRWDDCKAIRGRCHIARDLHRRIETTPAALIEKYSQPGLRSLGDNGWWRTYSVQHRVTDTWRYYRKMTKAEVAWWNTLSYEIRSELRAPYV